MDGFFLVELHRKIAVDYECLYLHKYGTVHTKASFLY